MPRSKAANRDRILATMRDGEWRQRQLAEHLGLGLATVSRWMAVLVSEGRVYLHRYECVPHGGPQEAIYRIGPRPGWHRVRREYVRTATERKAEWRVAQPRVPRRDPLTVALFGAASPRS